MSLEESSEVRSDFYWYVLNVFRDEDKCLSQIQEYIAVKGLQDRVVDARVFKEYEIVESEDYSVNSDELPKKGFKATKSCVWVRLRNGNFRKLRLVEKKSFPGMIFLKMEYNIDLFKMIRSWDAGFSFLGFPSPSPISDDQIFKTRSSLKSEAPDLNEYVQSKGYSLVVGSKSEFCNMVVESTKEEVKEEKIEETSSSDASSTTLSEEAIVAAKKAAIYSDLNIHESKSSFGISKEKMVKNKNKDKLQVNDFVYIKHLGFKGVIQAIDYENDQAIVGVQMFGRRQPVECKISEISDLSVKISGSSTNDEN